MQKAVERIKEKIDLLLAEATIIAPHNSYEAVALAEKALAISKQITEKDGTHIDVLNKLADFQRENKSFKLAFLSVTKAIELSSQIKYTNGEAIGRFILAHTLFDEDKPSQALPHLLQAVELLESSELKAEYAESLCLLGHIYELFTDYKEAIKNFHQSLDLANQIENQSIISSSNLHLAKSFIALNKLGRAKQFINKSLAIKKRYAIHKGLAETYFLKGKVHLQLKQPDEALSNLNYAHEHFIKRNDKDGTLVAQIEIGKAYVLLQKYKPAEEHLLKALQISKKGKSLKPQYECHFSLAQVYKTNEPLKAFNHLEAYTELKDKFEANNTQNIVDSFKIMARIDDKSNDLAISKAKASIIENKNNELDTFFYKVSHDLKGPITSLKSLGDLARKEDIKDENALQYLSMYDKQVNRLSTIITELIKITEFNHKEIELTTIDFYEMVDNCISLYTYLPGFKEIKFTINVGIELQFVSEWSTVNSIVQNLIENSIKYIDPDKKEHFVSITVDKGKNDVKIIVADNGTGISAEHQKRIFEMFFRASNSVEGTGLGLFILKRGVERLKGDVHLESEEGIGTTFTVSLPVK